MLHTAIRRQRRVCIRDSHTQGQLPAGQQPGSSVLIHLLFSVVIYSSFSFFVFSLLLLVRVSFSLLSRSLVSCLLFFF